MTQSELDWLKTLADWHQAEAKKMRDAGAGVGNTAWRFHATADRLITAAMDEIEYRESPPSQDSREEKP